MALDAGYRSHRAFTRAFRKQFGLTPDMIRARGTVDDILLVEPLNIDETSKPPLAKPRMEIGRTLRIAGFSERYAFENLAGLPALWEKLRAYVGHVPGQVGQTAYGISYNTDDNGFDYIAGVEVADLDSLPREFARLALTEQRYAVFTHSRHVSSVRATYLAIFNDRLPKWRYRSADAAVFERCDERFDPWTGMGSFEIWVPITT